MKIDELIEIGRQLKDHNEIGGYRTTAKLIDIALATLQAYKDGYVMMPERANANMLEEAEDMYMPFGEMLACYDGFVTARPQTELDKILGEQDEDR